MLGSDALTSHAAVDVLTGGTAPLLNASLQHWVILPCAVLA
jgi:hypothetical protein